ncbi:unnamed protein product [Mucor hiemalis]
MKVAFTKQAILVRAPELPIPEETTTNTALVLADRPDLVEDLKEKTLKQQKLISDILQRKASEITYVDLASVEDFHSQLAKITSFVEKELFPNQGPAKQSFLLQIK